jgi:hypothetical protein
MASLPVGLVLAALAVSIPFAEAAAQGAPQSDKPIIVYTGRGGGTPARDEWAAAQLLQRAEQQRRIRVIVGLNLEMRDVGGTADAARQSQALRAMQDAVAARVLGSQSADGVVRFSAIPFMSMFVNAAQVRRLLDDPAVTSIQEDRPIPPSFNRSGPHLNTDKV